MTKTPPKSGRPVDQSQMKQNEQGQHHGDTRKDSRDARPESRESQQPRKDGRQSSHEAHDQQHGQARQDQKSPTDRSRDHLRKN